MKSITAEESVYVSACTTLKIKKQFPVPHLIIYDIESGEENV